MAKRLNKNLAVALTGGFFLLTTLAMVWMIYDMQPKDPAPYVQRAKDAERNRHFEQASRYYFQAYQVAKKDPQYLLYVGDALAQNNEEEKAIRAWTQAVTQKPDLQEGWERILKLYLELSETFNSAGIWQEVGKYASELLKVNLQNALALHARGRSLLALRERDNTNADAGLAALEQASKIAPENVDFAFHLALRYRELKTEAEGKAAELKTEAENKPKEAARLKADAENFLKEAARLKAEAENVLQEAVRLNSERGAAASKARSYYGAFLAGEGRDDDALRMYDEALELAGDEPARRAKVRQEVARYWMMRWDKLRRDPDQSDAAKQAFNHMTALLEESAVIDPDSFDPAIMLCGAYSLSGQADLAIEVAEKRLAAGDISRQGMRARFMKISRYMLLLAVTERLLGKAEGLEVNSPERKDLVARAQKHVDDAEAELPKTAAALHLAGRVKLAQGDHARALELFQEADAAYPRPFWLNKKLLAVLLSERAQTGAALKHIEQAVRDPAADAVCWALYARLLVSNSKYQDALLVADEGLKRFKGYPELLAAKLIAYQGLDKPDLAKVVREEIEAQEAAAGKASGSGSALLNVVAMEGAGRSEDAIAAIEELLKTHPSDMNIVQRAVNLYMMAKRFDDARRVARQALDLDPEQEGLQRLNTLVDILADTQLSEAQRSEKMIEMIERVPDALDRAQQRAGWLMMTRRWDQAFASLQEAERICAAKIASEPTRQLEGRLRQIVDQQFAVALELKDDGRERRLDDIAKRAVELDIDGLNGLTYRGVLHLSRSEGELAIATFRQALDQQPANSRVLTLLGRAYLLMRRADDARESFARAVEMNPNETEAHIFLARLAKDLGDDELLERELDVCERLAPENPWVKQQILERQELDAPLEAIPRREARRASDPKDWRNLVLLARLYLRTRQSDKAEACYAEARQADPTAAGPVLDWSNYLRATRRSDDALQLLEKYRSEAADNEHRALAQLMIGQHYRMLGDLQKANAEFVAAAELHGTMRILTAVADHFRASGQSALAAQRNALAAQQNGLAAEWYGKALAKAEQEQSAQARTLHRQLLNVLMVMNDFERAQKETEKYLATNPGDPFGLLMQAELEFRNGRADEAIRIVDGILAKETAYADAVFSRARYQLTVGRWDRAIADLENLKAIAPDYRSFEPRLRLGYLYERMGRLEKAEAELQSIVEGTTATLRPQSPPEVINAATAAVEALVDFYRRQQRFGDAQRIATSWINRNPNDARWFQWYQKRGELFVQTNETVRALEDYLKACELTKDQPAHAGALAAYLNVCLRLNRLEEGARFHRERIPEELRTLEVRVAYATLLAKQGDAEAAVNEYRNAVSGGTPEELVQSMAVARTASLTLGPARALELFRVPPVDARQAAANEFMLASLTSLSGDTSGAIEQLKTLLSKADADVVRWSLALQIAALSAEQGDHASARHYYEETLRLNPNSLAALNNLAFLLTDALHEPQKAIPYARKAVQIAALPAVYDTLGWAYFKAGQFEAALGALNQAVQLDPSLTAGYLHLADVYRCRGEFPRAESLLRDTLKRIEKTPEEGEYQQQILDLLKRIEQKDQKP